MCYQFKSFNFFIAKFLRELHWFFIQYKRTLILTKNGMELLLPILIGSCEKKKFY